MKRIGLALLTLALTFSFIGSVSAVYDDSSVGTYEQELAKFPCDYQEKIKQLHNIYPNAVFVSQNEFYDWDKKKEVPVKWNDMLTAELYIRNRDGSYTNARSTKSLIHNSAQASYKTSDCGEYSGSTCVYYIASQSAVEHYMNPYNFLDERRVFMFESQFNKNYYTENGIERILSNTFMSHANCSGSSKTYAGVILEASRDHDINIGAYSLASRIKQEQGSKGNTLSSGTYQGYTGIYNYFNINAGGKTATERITNGLMYAKNQGWTSPYLAIIGGTKFVYDQYIGDNDRFNVRGQLTTYLQKWDPYGNVYAGKQYMQNIVAPYSEAGTIYNAHSMDNDYKNKKYIFHIPIFVGAPNTSDTTSCSTGNIGGDTSSDVKKGDVNDDGKVSSADYLMIRDYIMGNYNLEDNYKSFADVTGDGKVTSADYLKIRDYIMGIINSL